VPAREATLRPPFKECAAGIEAGSTVKLAAWVAAIGIALTGVIPAKAEKAKAVEVGHGAAIKELPVRFLDGNLPVVQGSIGGRSGLNIMVDTGSSPAILDQRLARSLGVEKEPGQLQLIDGVWPAEAAWIPDIRVGPVEMHEMPALIRDLSYLKEEFGVSVAAIVGLDFLGEASFRLDYKARRLTFGDIAAEGIAVPIGKTWPFAVVNAEVQQQRVRLLVDTGAGALVLIRDRLSPRMPGFAFTRAASVESLGGRIQSASALRYTRVAFTVEGTLRHTESVFLVPDSGRFKDFDGLLAVRSAGFRALSYDHKSQTLYLAF